MLIFGLMKQYVLKVSISTTSIIMSGGHLTMRIYLKSDGIEIVMMQMASLQIVIQQILVLIVHIQQFITIMETMIIITTMP